MATALSPRGMARPAPAPLRLGMVVVDPARTTRAGVALLIASQSDMEVLGQASSAEEGLQLVRRLRRRSRVVIVVGLGLSGEHDAFWLIRRVREHCPHYVVVGSGDAPGRLAISRALFEGADGYLDASADPLEFLEALRQASQGEVVLAGIPTDYLGPISDGIEMQRDAESPLTNREREVLSAAAEGLTAREIGARLTMAERTVTTHLAHIYGKLGVGGRVEAITEAARAGLVTVGWVN